MLPLGHNAASALFDGRWKSAPAAVENADTQPTVPRIRGSRAGVSDAVSGGVRLRRLDPGAATDCTTALARRLSLSLWPDGRVTAKRHQPCNGSPFPDG